MQSGVQVNVPLAKPAPAGTFSAVIVSGSWFGSVAVTLKVNTWPSVTFCTPGQVMSGEVAGGLIDVRIVLRLLDGAHGDMDGVGKGAALEVEDLGHGAGVQGVDRKGVAGIGGANNDLTPVYQLGGALKYFDIGIGLIYLFYLRLHTIPQAVRWETR